MQSKTITVLPIMWACFFVVAAVACGPAADPSADAWEKLGQDAENVLGTAERDLEGVAKIYGGMAQEGVERWSKRIKGARQEIASEVAASPEKRRRERAELEHEIQEIKDGVGELLTKIESQRDAG